MKHNKFLAYILSFSVIAALCTGCGNDSDDSQNSSYEAAVTVMAKKAGESASESSTAAVSATETTSSATNASDNPQTRITTPTVFDNPVQNSSSASGGMSSYSPANGSQGTNGSSGSYTSPDPGSGSDSSANSSSAGQSSPAGSSSNNTNTNNNSGTNSSSGSNSSGNSNNSYIQEETEPAETENITYVSLSGSGAQSDDYSNLSINGSVITISGPGKYEFSGTIDNGQIIVNAGKEDKVDIYLNGAGITCSDSAPICVQSADTCTLHLKSGSTNYVQDSASNSLSACIYSKDDLTIKGEGSLTVVSSKKHGIKSSNDVKVKNGSITISCPSTGIYGEDSVQISGGSIVIAACKDGIKASNTQEAEKGFVTIENGYIDIQNAAGNGIEAISSVTISSGVVNVHSAKKSVNCDYQTITDGCLYEY
ncbi:MAG: carbohydrate-binding domain-containing protein [Porcipelethomonas sp.]